MNTLPPESDVITAPKLLARFTSFTLPEAVRRSSLAKWQKISSKKVPVPGP